LLDFLSIVIDIFSNNKSKIISITDFKYESKIGRNIVFLAYGPKIRLDHINFLEEMFKEGYKIYLVRQGFDSFETDNLKFATVIYRQNVGRDLAGFRDAAKTLLVNHARTEGVTIFLNDTMQWNRQTINLMISKSQLGWEIVGVTTSHQLKRHIQTYGLLIKNEVLEKFMATANWKNWRLKRSIVHLGEIDLLKRISRDGISATSLIDGWELQREMLLNNEFSTDLRKNKKFLIKIPLNPTGEMSEGLAKKLYGLRKC
jgi:hypothetical protein